MLFETLISTTFTRRRKAISLAIEIFKVSGIRSMIVCQTFDCPPETKVTANYEDDAFRIFFVKSKGLAKSRNFAVTNSDAEYAWLLDDDVQIDAQCLQELLSGVNNARGAAALTFRFSDRDGNTRKTYSANGFVHNFFSIMKVSSIEIVINVKFVNLHNISFDERFGLGARYPSGEENIFLSDVLKKKGEIRFIPSIICYHPVETSASVKFVKKQWVAKGALLARTYGLGGAFLVIPFALRRVVGGQATAIGCFKGIKEMLIGFNDVL